MGATRSARAGPHIRIHTDGRRLSKAPSFDVTGCTFPEYLSDGRDCVLRPEGAAAERRSQPAVTPVRVEDVHGHTQRTGRGYGQFTQGLIAVWKDIHCPLILQVALCKTLVLVE